MSDENVGRLVAKWREEATGDVSTDYEEGRVAEKLRCAFQLEAALSAHGQPAVDEDMVERALMAYQTVSYGCNTRALRTALAAAIGATK